MGTVALLALMAMACGSSDAPSSPDAVAQVQQNQDGNQPDPSDPGASSATDTADREGNQQTGDSTQGSVGATSEEPTDTPRPTPDLRPDATPTPQPTPTVVPTPTPDPMGPAFNLMRGYGDDPYNQVFLDLYKYNVHLAKDALSEPLTDPVGEQHPDLLALNGKDGVASIIFQGLDITELEHVPSDDGQLQVKIYFDLYLHYGRNNFTHSGSATGVVDLVSPPYENTRFPQRRELEAFTDQVPVFSHVTGTPILEPAQ